MGFWVASADAAGTRIVGSEEELLLSPAAVEYPAAMGVIEETAGGSVIQQFSAKDARRRTWVWQNLPNYVSVPRYIQMIHRLESLVAVTRRARGLSPWIWFKDEETDEFRVLRLSQGTATATGASTLTDSGQAWTVNALQNSTIEIVDGVGAGQRRSIASNTATQVTVTEAWGTQPAGADYSIQWSDPAWIRVRVLKVSKEPNHRGGVSFDPVRVEFVVDDANWNALGYRVDP